MRTTQQYAQYREQIKRYSAPLRLWHWLTVAGSGSLVRVLINSTILDKKSVEDIKLNMESMNADDADKPARDILHTYRDKAWQVHTYIGYCVAAQFLFRLILELFQVADQKLARKVKGAYRQFLALKPNREGAFHEPFVKTIYACFYLMLVVIAATGLCMAFEDDVPALKAIGKSMHQVHGFTMYLIIGFMVLHLAGVMLGELKKDKGIVSDMINGGSTKKLLTILCLMIVAGSAMAQQGNDRGPGGSAPTGRVYGRLLDKAGHAIDFAAVMVLKSYTDPTTGAQKRTLVKGTNTESNGDFSLDEVPLNTPLKLTASALGYTDLNMDITLTPRSSQKDLGKLRMAAADSSLKEVTVTATKPYMSVDMEKKVFNVTKDIVSAGGNGIDVIKNVPSVNVDIDGNVTLRGGSPQIFVDGKPTTLTLDEIPSDAIESIEVITNPSAKYDASGGGAGIINIVLKKNTKSGYNGNVHAGADGYGGTNVGGSLNVRTKKFNFSANVNARRSIDYTTASLQRTSYGSTPETYLDEQERDSSASTMFFTKLSLDYNISNHTTLSVSGFVMQHSSQTNSNINMNTDSLYAGGKINQYSREEINSSHTFGGRGATLNMKHNFAKENETWTADANYFSGDAVNSSLYTTNNYQYGEGSPLTSSELQKTEGSGNDHNIFLQSDYSNPVISGMTLEAGVRAAFQSRLNINNNYTYDPSSGFYDLVPAAASNYKSRSDVYAAYTTLGGNMGDYSYKAGLRAESSSYEGTLLNSGQTFSNSYPVSLFPSLFFGRKLTAGQELQLTYTRRVNRPNFNQLIPYTDSSNKLNITRGNPNLVPEFTQSVEFSYIRNLKGGTFIGSAYYKYTDHLITGYITSDTSASGAISYINTYVNAASGQSIGAEATGQYALTKWWDLTANVNVYQSQIDLGPDEGPSQPALLSWFAKLNMNFRLPAGFSFQLSGLYQSKANLPVNTNSNQPGPPNMQAQSAAQGYIDPYYEVDLAVKKMFLKNKVSVSFSVNDIFRSHIQDQYTYSDYFTQDYSRLRDPQMMRLNVAYNFGKLDTKIFDRKNSDAQTED